MDLYPTILTFGQFPEQGSGNTLVFGQWVLATSARFAIYVAKDGPCDVTQTQPQFYSNSDNPQFEYSYEPDSVYYIGVTQINECGLESTPKWLAIKIDSAGNIAGIIVGAISWVEVITLASGQIKVRWRYDSNLPDPQGFYVYTGRDEVSCNTLIATETFIKGKNYYSVTITPPYSDGFIGIAAYSGTIEGRVKLKRFSCDSNIEAVECYGTIREC